MNKVTHCICYDKPIKDIVKEAKQKNLKSIEEIVAEIKCADMCQMCVPYIEEKLNKDK